MPSGPPALPPLRTLMIAWLLLRPPQLKKPKVDPEGLETAIERLDDPSLPLDQHSQALRLVEEILSHCPECDEIGLYLPDLEAALQCQVWRPNRSGPSCPIRLSLPSHHAPVDNSKVPRGCMLR